MLCTGPFRDTIPLLQSLSACLLSLIGAVRDSSDIARWTDAHSALPGANPLFPPAQIEDVIRCKTVCTFCHFKVSSIRYTTSCTRKPFVLPFSKQTDCQQQVQCRFDKHCLEVLEYERGVFTTEARNSPVQS